YHRAEQVSQRGEALPAHARCLVSDCKRPFGAIEDVVPGFGHYASVDQRAASQPIRDHGTHIGADAHVEQPFALAPRARRSVRRKPDVTGQIGKTWREHPGEILAPALEHANPHLSAAGIRRTGKTRGGNRAAIAAAHDDDVEIDGRWRRLGIAQGYKLLEAV